MSKENKLSVDETLKEREGQYGNFYEQAYISQSIRSAMQEGRNYEKLDVGMEEALHMIAHKIARILNGNPYHRDSWHDIAGYAKLIVDKIDIETNNN